MVRYRIVALLLIYCALMGVMVGAQTSEVPTTTAHRRVTLHAGPGHTYSPVDVLNAGLPVVIVERNRIGNWLYVERRTENGEVAQAGWLQLGYLNIPPELRFSALPVNEQLPDADTENVSGRSIKRLYSAPVIPQISDAMIAVYWRGQSLGRDARVVTKVGDSLSADVNYLGLFAKPDPILGPFDYLADTLVYYQVSAGTESVAAKIGLSSLVLFNPIWADKTVCEPNETPLECEYRLKNPSVALIMFGPNDVLSMTYEEYGENMRRAVEDSLAAGVIPVLSTFSYHPDNEFWEQSVAFNLQLLDLAEEYEVPLINLWAASRPLPDYGLDIDLLHMKQSGFGYLKFDTGHETWYGTSLRNLLALRMLHEIRTKLSLNLEADA